jgi:hypothetical protein
MARIETVSLAFEKELLDIDRLAAQTLLDETPLSSGGATRR